MKKLLFTILALLLAVVPAYSKKKADNNFNYEIAGAGTAAQGEYLVKITVITKDKNLKDADLRRAAVHGVLFRGFSNSEKRQSQKPLAGSAANEAQHADFYKAFFDENGTAASYASTVGGSRTMVKSSKKEYSVSAIVTVRKEALHKYLEESGVVKGLNSAF